MFWWGNLKERYYFEDPDINGRIKEVRWVVAWSALIWLGTGTVDWLL
jgi:hypothetical protein